MVKKLQAEGVAKDLIRIIAGCLTKIPEHRYENAKELAEDLKSVLKDEKPLNIKRIEKKSGKPVMLKIAISISVVLAVLGFSLVTLSSKNVDLGPITGQFRLSHIKSNYITDDDLRKATLADKMVRSVELKHSQVTDNGLRYLAEFRQGIGLHQRL